MSVHRKHRRNKRRQGRSPAKRADRGESRASEAMTVAWTVTVMTLLICELGGLAAALVLRWMPKTGGLRPFIGFTQFSALLLAVLSMGLLPIVYRVRRVAPPAPLVAFAVVAAAAPFVLVVWQALN